MTGVPAPATGALWSQQPGRKSPSREKGGRTCFARHRSRSLSGARKCCATQSSVAGSPRSAELIDGPTASRRHSASAPLRPSRPPRDQPPRRSDHPPGPIVGTHPEPNPSAIAARSPFLPPTEPAPALPARGGSVCPAGLPIPRPRAPGLPPTTPEFGIVVAKGNQFGDPGSRSPCGELSRSCLAGRRRSRVQPRGPRPRANLTAGVTTAAEVSSHHHAPRAVPRRHCRSPGVRVHCGRPEPCRDLGHGPGRDRRNATRFERGRRVHGPDAHRAAAADRANGSALPEPHLDPCAAVRIASGRRGPADRPGAPGRARRDADRGRHPRGLGLDRVPRRQHVDGVSGRADVATGRDVEADTAFSVASISKTFLAALILDLSAEGRFGLEDGLGRVPPGAEAVPDDHDPSAARPHERAPRLLPAPADRRGAPRGSRPRLEAAARRSGSSASRTSRRARAGTTRTRTTCCSVCSPNASTAARWPSELRARYFGPLGLTTAWYQGASAAKGRWPMAID